MSKADVNLTKQEIENALELAFVIGCNIGRSSEQEDHSEGARAVQACSLLRFVLEFYGVELRDERDIYEAPATALNTDRATLRRAFSGDVH